jgi:hypothetical protein
MKDCIEIWQKATIKDALPEEYKDKQKAEEIDTDLNRPQNLLLLTKSAIFCPQFHTNGIFGHGIWT